MPFHRIEGRFRVINTQPDGDTIRFVAADPASLDRLDGVPARRGALGSVSLRLEGIDALETHYEGLRQPRRLADAATDALLDHLRVANVVWAQERRSVISASEAEPGHILARSTDKYGRVVAFALPGGGGGDEDSVFVRPADIEPSANMALLRAGLAYPTFYWSLFAELRAALGKTARAARTAGLGVHEVDRTRAGVTVTSLASITDDHVVLPKLFRRLSTFIRANGSVAGFKAALEASREPVFDTVEANFTHFDTFIEQDGDTVRLTRDPEQLVFDPMPQRLGTDFTALVEAGTVAPGPLAGSTALAEPAAFARRLAVLRADRPDN